MTPRHYILDADHRPVPVPVLEWTRWCEDAANCIVAQETVGDVYVSTVFLGLDHNWQPDGNPVLWETMIFGGPDDRACERYTSHTEALAGHAKALARAQAAATTKGTP